MSGAPENGCDEWRVILHGFVDGELDSARAAHFEQHLATCPGCTEELEKVQAMTKILDQEGIKWKPPEALRSQVLSMLSFEQAAIMSAPPQRQRVTVTRRIFDVIRQWSFVPSLAALAAALLLFVNAPSQTLLLQDQIMASHVRSMMADHLTDVLTSDQHTVKPWFNGKIDFSPPVSDLAKEGFPLVGARVDYIGNRAVAALVYRRHGHVINLFIWPAATSTQANTAHDGYKMMQWSDGGFVFWAISDVASSDLAEFEAAFKGSQTLARTDAFVR